MLARIASWCGVILLLLLTTIDAAYGEVRVAHLFGDQMVLPRDASVPVWGWAEAGESITVEFDEQRKSTTADAQGKWMLTLAPLSASATSRDLKITGSKSAAPVVFRDVLVGEVWLASGQSNMATGAGPAAAEADTPLVRFAAVESFYPGAPAPDLKSRCRWRNGSAATAPSCSGTALWFARRLQAELGIPVGVVVSAVGGSRAEHWTRREILEKTAGPDAYVAKILDQAKKAQTKPASSESVGKFPGHIVGTQEWIDGRLGGRFNGMIAPLAPFPFRGVLWYQGEDNAGDFAAYAALLPAMIADWRTLWNRELPFLIVQLPAYSYQRQPDGTTWAAMREVQAQIARKVPGCGLAVTLDNVDPDQLHPKNKRTVGDRLAAVALRQVYGRDAIPVAPSYDSMTIAGGTIRLRFRNVGEGLVSRSGDQLKGFSVAGSDRRFIAAEARLEGNEVIVSSEDVSEPVAVRYAWVNAPTVSLYDRTGMPVAPFRTDDWKP